MTCLIILSCGPVDPIVVEHNLENVESSLEPQKENYNLSDKITLMYSFELDSDKFYEYEYRISISDINKESEPLYDHIIVYNESGENVTNNLNCQNLDNETTKIIKNFSLIPKEKGSYLIFIGGYALQRNPESNTVYRSGHVHYLHIQ